MNVMRITYQEPSGTEGVQLAPGTYSRHPLNTVTLAAIPGAALTTDGCIHLEPGCYLVRATVAKPYGVPARLALRSLSKNAILAEGVNNGPAGAGGGPFAHLDTPLFITDFADKLELALYADTGSFTLGPGVTTGLPLSNGNPEVYAEVTIVQLPPV